MRVVIWCLSCRCRRGLRDVHSEARRLGAPPDHRMKTLDVTLSIVVGDLFAHDNHLAVGFSDTFDTSVADDRIIHSASVQGQLLHRIYDGNQQRLDEELAAALAAMPPVRTESRADKPYGKLARYPIGTVAVLGEPQRLASRRSRRRGSAGRHR